MGVIFTVVGTIGLKVSDNNKDLSDFDTKAGVVSYREEYSDGSIYYYPTATFYIDGVEYTWESNSGSTSKIDGYPSGSSVIVYYNVSDPSDNAAPDLANDMIWVIFRTIGIVFIIIAVIIVGIPVIKLGLVVLIVGSSNKKNNQQYNQQYNQQFNQQYDQQYGQQYNQQFNQQYGQQYGQQNFQHQQDFSQQPNNYWGTNNKQ